MSTLQFTGHIQLHVDNIAIKKAQHKIINLLKIVSFMSVIWFSSSTVYILSVNTVDDNIVSQDQKIGYVIKSKN